MLFMAIAILVTWETFDQTKATTWIFIAAMISLLAIIAGFYLYIIRRLRRQPSMSHAGG
jgi:hypothetical protein